MPFWKDILNGGIDRDFDGDIDDWDREIAFEDDCRRREEEERRGSYFSENDSWKDDYSYDMRYGIDPEDYDDEDEYLDALERAREERESAFGLETVDEEEEDYDFDEDELWGVEKTEREGEYDVRSTPKKTWRAEERAVYDYDEVKPLEFTVSLSFEEPKRTKPSDGVWKYYDESFGGNWHYDRALIEHFSELAIDYEANGDETLANIIKETYAIDRERAVKYLKWLWETFTPDLFADEEEAVYERQSYRGRGLLIEELINEEPSEELYRLLKSDEDFLHAAFRDCVHQKHECGFVKDYMILMITYGDAPAAKVVYERYLEGQKGRYSDNDLAKLWEDVVHNIDWLDFDDKEKLSITQFFVPTIEGLGVRSRKPLATLAEYQKGWKEAIAIAEEIDKEEREEEQEGERKEEPAPVVARYAWRKSVAPSKMRYADPCEYETPEEFEKAVAIGYAKYEEEKAKKRREGYTKENVCRFCTVDLIGATRSTPYYLTGDLDLSVGDEVIVPYGKENEEVQGLVVATGTRYASTFPFDIRQIKTVLRVERKANDK